MRVLHLVVRCAVSGVVVRREVGLAFGQLRMRGVRRMAGMRGVAWVAGVRGMVRLVGLGVRLAGVRRVRRVVVARRAGGRGGARGAVSRRRVIGAVGRRRAQPLVLDARAAAARRQAVQQRPRHAPLPLKVIVTLPDIVAGLRTIGTQL